MRDKAGQKMILLVGALPLLVTSARADVPRLIHYQGKLVTSAGAIVPGPVSLRARLYDTLSAPTPILFDESHAAVQLNRGLFSILLGSQTGVGVPDSVLSQPSVYLGVSVDGAAELSPRIRIATAPFAGRTRSAEQLVRPDSAAAAVTVDAAGRVGVGTGSPSPTAALDVASTTGGMLVPRMTSAQRDALVGPDPGLFLFNLDTNCFNMWDGITWRQSCFDCTFSAPTPGNSGPICEGSTLSLTATTILSATYAWSGPNGFSSNQQNPSIPDATPAASGPYSVTATRDGCTTSAVTTVATVNPTPTTPPANNNGPVCIGDTLQLSSAAVPGATYSWTGPNGFESSVANPILTNVTLAAAGQYTLVITVNGCVGQQSSTNVQILDVPGAPDPITGPASVCLSATGQTYSVTDVPTATSYTWTVPSGATVASGQGTAFATVNFGTASGQVCVSAVNQCGSGATTCMNVNVQSDTSCALILACNPGSPSGQYNIDPDGPSGGQSPFSVYCDMTTDGGGWTIVTAHNGSTGQPSLTSNSESGGNPLSFQTYNLNQVKKELISAVSTESLFRRSAGPWLKASHALFDDNLTGNGNQHPHWQVTVTANNGATATNCQMGYSNFANSNGGDYGITISGATFDHHSTNEYHHLNGSCEFEYLYQYGTTYNVNTSLGSWSMTQSCSQNNTSMGAFYAAMR